MADSIIEKLQQSAEKALQSSSINEAMQHLAKAFTLFTQESSRLQTAYNSLQNNFQSVNKELQTTSTYLQSILQNIDQGIVFINTEKVITLYNIAAENILKKNSEELFLKRYDYFFPDDFFGFSLSNALKYHLSLSVRYITLKSSNTLPIEIEIETNFINQKNQQGLFIFLKDISQLQQLQMIAKRNDRMKKLGEMTTTLAHEIRNPIGGIRGYASLLYRDLEGLTSLQTMVKNIIDSTKGLEKLVTNVLFFAKPIQIEPKTCDLSQIVLKAVQFMKVDPNFPEKTQFETHISHRPLLAPVDEQVLYRALLNLVVNAYQSMEGEGKITLSLLKRDHNALLTIADTGKGISTEDLHKIFTPFFTTKSRGHGLGLSEANKIIQAHNGRIEVHSQENKGTTFTITLPLRR